MKFGNSIFKTFFLSLCIVANTSFAYAQTASILPPAKTTFVDQNGKPLVGGKVDFYIPGTTTRKTTWQDSAEGTANTNPVILDSAGRALILGDGAYRQVVKDRNDNLIWDQVTSSLGSGSGSTTTIGDGLPVGSILPNSGFVAPANYQFAYGQALLRSTYANLFSAITISTSIGCVGGSPLINVSDTSSLSVGTVLESICVSGGPTIVSKTSSTVTLSSNANVTVSTTGVFFPYGNGNGLTTFNVPDMRGYVAAGRCNMGGVDCSVLNSTYFSSNTSNTPSGMNAKGGSQNKTLAVSNLPPYTPAGTAQTVAPNSQNFATATSTLNVNTAGGGTPILVNPIANSSVATTTFSGIAQGGTSASFSLVQPTLTLNYVIKVLPDSNLTSTFGVGSIGGMTGIIACGSGITCAGNTISFSFVGVNSIQGMTGAITCGSGLTCSAGSMSANGVNPQVISSRTAASALDLSIYSVVKTLGYAAAGDNGGATFKKVAVPFRDSYVVTPTVVGNGTSTCTNGSYLGVAPTGGTGTNLIVNVTVAGNIVSAVTLAGTGGNGYTTGDTVSTTITGCSTTVTFNVGTVSTASGSFTDSAGNKWQIIPDSGNFLNVKQFGAKVDYAGVDGSATNDYTAIQNAYSYCADIHSPTIDGGGSAGCKIIHPAGNSLVCGGVPLEIPQGVGVEGSNVWASTLKMCTAWTSGVNFINVCNPNSHLACFGSYIQNLTLYSAFTQVTSANTSMIYSNSVQQIDFLNRVAIYSGQRECIRLESGFGGAALLGMQNVECTPGNTSVSAGILINYGTTLVTMRNVHVETGGPWNSSGLRITGGFVHLIGFHTEGITTGIEANITGTIASGFVKLEDLTGGVNCTNLVLKQTGSVASSLYVSNLTQNGCTNSVNNAGALTATFIGIWTLF